LTTRSVAVPTWSAVVPTTSRVHRRGQISHWLTPAEGSDHQPHLGVRSPSVSARERSSEGSDLQQTRKIEDVTPRGPTDPPRCGFAEGVRSPFGSARERSSKGSDLQQTRKIEDLTPCGPTASRVCRRGHVEGGQISAGYRRGVRISPHASCRGQVSTWLSSRAKY